jgi:hypothetical protein
MKSLKLYLIIGSALLLIYIIAQVNRPKVVDWSESFSDKEKTPFGTYIVYNRLKDIFPKSQVSPYRQTVYSVIAEDSIKNASYIIISNAVDLTKTDYEQLAKYLNQGNDVFIASTYFGKALDKFLNIKTEILLRFSRDTSDINFLNPRLKAQKAYTFDKGAGSIYFSKFDTTRAIVIGENANHKANFLKYSFGKGSLYLVANPKLFSNYALLNPRGAEYAATALSYIKSTRQVIWDEYYSQGDGAEDSPMRVFLSKPALAWAYYITIFSLLTFVLFEIKRTQRIIPVIEPLSNTTLEFVNVVGQVYYEKRNNANIAHKKILYLLEHLREEYQLKTNKLDAEFTEKLTGKLGVDAAFAKDLVNYLLFIGVQEHVSDRELIELNKMIEKLYIQSA